MGKTNYKHLESTPAEQMTADSLKVEVLRGDIYLQGKCGQVFRFPKSEWKKLKKKVKNKIKADPFSKVKSAIEAYKYGGNDGRS